MKFDVMSFTSLKYGILFFFFLAKLYGSAQTDSTYIEPFPYNFSAKIYVSKNLNSLLHTYFSELSAYEPNRPFYIGAGFSWKKMGFSASYGFDFLRNSKKGNTRSLDLQYNYYGKKILFDAMIQVYEGFYKDNTEQDSYDIYKDLKTVRLGLYGQYVFNSDRFSYPAAFSQKEKQIKSAGSFLIGLGVYYTQIHSDIPNFFSDSTEGYFEQTNIQFGPTAGYAYTWAIVKKYFISLSLSAGMNIGFNEKGKNVALYPAFIPRFATGYNAESWSLGLAYYNNLIFTHFKKDRQIGISSGGIQLTFIKRFYLKTKEERRRQKEHDSAKTSG